MGVKFAQLLVGANFNYRERRFRKVSPIEAIDLEHETRKVIPRSAKVVCADENGRTNGTALPAQLSRNVVEAAVADFATTLLSRLQHLEPPLTAEQSATITTLVQSIHQDCVAQLTLPDRTPDPAAQIIK